MANVERKLKVYNTERYTVSKFQSIDVAAMYFYWNPTQGPFIVVGGRAVLTVPPEAVRVVLVALITVLTGSMDVKGPERTQTFFFIISCFPLGGPQGLIEPIYL